MKTRNWKYALVVKTMVTACAAGLLLFTTSAMASLSKPFFGRQLLTFDQIASDSAVPNGYGSVNWINFYALDAVNYVNNPSGYEADIISPNNVLYNGGGSPAAIYADGWAFVLNSAYLAGAWNDNLQVQVDGYFGNRRVYSRTYTLSATHPTRINFPSAFVTEVDFTSFGGTPHAGYPGGGEHFATDNVTVTVFPIPVRPPTLHLP